MDRKRLIEEYTRSSKTINSKNELRLKKVDPYVRYFLRTYLKNKPQANNNRNPLLWMCDHGMSPSIHHYSSSVDSRIDKGILRPKGSSAIKSSEKKSSRKKKS